MCIFTRVENDGAAASLFFQPSHFCLLLAEVEVGWDPFQLTRHATCPDQHRARLKLQPTKLVNLQLHINKWSGWRAEYGLLDNWISPLYTTVVNQNTHSVVWQKLPFKFAFYHRKRLEPLFVARILAWTVNILDIQRNTFHRLHFMQNCTVEALLTHLKHTRWKSQW